MNKKCIFCEVEFSFNKKDLTKTKETVVEFDNSYVSFPECKDGLWGNKYTVEIPSKTQYKITRQVVSIKCPCCGLYNIIIKNELNREVLNRIFKHVFTGTYEECMKYQNNMRLG